MGKNGSFVYETSCNNEGFGDCNVLANTFGVFGDRRLKGSMYVDDCYLRRIEMNDGVLEVS